MIVYKIVEHQYVEGLTRDGWCLEKIIASTRTEKIELATPIATQAPENCYGGVGTSPREEALAVNVPLFVLVKTLEVITREEALQAKFDTLNAASKKFEAEHVTLAKQYKVMQSDLADRKRAHDLDLARLVAAEDRYKRLESDLAKVSAVIGSAAYDAAINADKKAPSL